MMKLVRSKITGGCYHSRMSDSEQDAASIASETPVDAPVPEAIPAEVIAEPPVTAAPPASADTVPAVPALSAGAEASIIPPTLASDSPSDSPAEIPAPEHSNILENVGMSVEPHESATLHVPDNASAPVPPPTEPSAPAVVSAYAALLSLRDKALNAIQFRRQARLEKIMALAAKKKSIGNDDVEKLLHVSDATVSRYLSALVQEGKLNRTGSAKAIRYSLPIAPSTGGDTDPIAPSTGGDTDPIASNG